jgi:hypothetical protein
VSGDETTTALYRALAVVTEDPRHVEWLKRTDPNALNQALSARKLHLDDQLAAMVTPLDNGAISLGNSLARMSIGNEIEALDARLIEVQHILAGD